MEFRKDILVAIKKASDNNKAFTILFALNIILFIADFTTTFLNKDILPNLELNPLYKISGSLLLPFLFNFLWFALIWHCYIRNASKPWHRFSFINVLVLVGTIRIYAIKNALSWLFRADRVQAAGQVSSEAYSVAQYNLLLLTLVPVVYCMLIYWVWERDHFVWKRKI